MANISFQQAEKMSNWEGGTTFSVKPGESVNVRFMYNTLDEVQYISVHDYIDPQNYKNSATIDCPRTDNDPMDVCKWCMKTGKNPVVRTFLQVYNESTGKVQLWKRTYKFMTQSLIPIIQSLVPVGQPVSGQVFKVIRSGTGRDTAYNFVPIGTNDGRRPEQLGQLLDPKATGHLKDSDYEPPESTTEQDRPVVFGQTNTTPYTVPQSTRTTTNMFN